MMTVLSLMLLVLFYMACVIVAYVFILGVIFAVVGVFCAIIMFCLGGGK